MGEFSGVTSRFMELRWSHNNIRRFKMITDPFDPAFANRFAYVQGGIERINEVTMLKAKLNEIKSIKTAYQKKKTCTIIKTMIAGGDTTAPLRYFLFSQEWAIAHSSSRKKRLEHARAKINHWRKNRSSYLHGYLLGC